MTMDMDKGIIYVVLGDRYDKLAAHTLCYSRKFTQLPFCVVTNIKATARDPKWSEVSDVGFIEVDLPQNKNRFVKTCLPEFTPFDKTLYLDCDAVIQKQGIEQVFDMLDDCDMVLSYYLDWKPGDKIVKIARDVMRLAGVKLPLRVYCGAFICWDNANKKVTESVFPEWYTLWALSGRGRDMFQFCCSIKKNEARICEVDTEIRNGSVRTIFEPNTPNLKAIVQHNYNTTKSGQDFHDNFGLPRIQEYKPFDSDSSDWNWVEEDSE